MNCIFCCVFDKETAIDLFAFYLFLESIFLYGNLDETTEILIYTSTSIMNTIKESYIFNSDKIKFEVNDDKCGGLSDLFTLPSIKMYNKILYLDTDVELLVKGDINILFNICQKEVLYVTDQGVLLCNNNKQTAELFRNNIFECDSLKDVIVDNDTNIYSDKVIHRFLGTNGDYQDNVIIMTDFLNKMKNKSTGIPKIFFQTHHTRPENYVIDMITSMLSPGWRYEFYDDAEVIKYFINNPIDDLPNIIQIYNSFRNGAHKGDLFRYYYLYLNGGFFMDSDAMIYTNIDNVIKNYDLVSVYSRWVPGTIFQGILGASPKNEIIKRSLYETCRDAEIANSGAYHHFCKQLYDTLQESNYGYNIKIYEESTTTQNWHDGDDILDGETILFRHHRYYKVIPKLIS